MRPGFHFVGVTTPFYCNDGKGNFLFNKRSVKCRDFHGFWDVGAGKLEFGQTPEENVLREVKEEYGCAGKIQEKLPYFTSIREWEGKKTHWMATPFFVLVDPEEVQINDPEKIDALEWFKLNELPDAVHPAFIEFLEMHPKVFEKYKN